MGHKAEPFSLLEGNFDVYFHKTHDYYWDLEKDGRSKEPFDDRDQYKDLSKLIKNAQKKYTGVSINEEILSMEKRTLKTHEFSQFEDRYQIFAFPALICLLLELLLPGGRMITPKARSRYA